MKHPVASCNYKKIFHLPVKEPPPYLTLPWLALADDLSSQSPADNIAGPHADGARAVDFVVRAVSTIG